MVARTDFALTLPVAALVVAVRVATGESPQTLWPKWPLKGVAHRIDQVLGSMIEKYGSHLTQRMGLPLEGELPSPPEEEQKPPVGYNSHELRNEPPDSQKGEPKIAEGNISYHAQQESLRESFSSRSEQPRQMPSEDLSILGEDNFFQVQPAPPEKSEEPPHNTSKANAKSSPAQASLGVNKESKPNEINHHPLRQDNFVQVQPAPPEKSEEPPRNTSKANAKSSPDQASSDVNKESKPNEVNHHPYQMTPWWTQNSGAPTPTTNKDQKMNALNVDRPPNQPLPSSVQASSNTNKAPRQSAINHHPYQMKPWWLEKEAASNVGRSVTEPLMEDPHIADVYLNYHHGALGDGATLPPRFWHMLSEKEQQAFAKWCNSSGSSTIETIKNTLSSLNVFNTTIWPPNNNSSSETAKPKQNHELTGQTIDLDDIIKGSFSEIGGFFGYVTKTLSSYGSSYIWAGFKGYGYSLIPDRVKMNAAKVQRAVSKIPPHYQLLAVAGVALACFGTYRFLFPKPPASTKPSPVPQSSDIQRQLEERLMMQQMQALDMQNRQLQGALRSQQQQPPVTVIVNTKDYETPSAPMSAPPANEKGPSSQRPNNKQPSSR